MLLFTLPPQVRLDALLPALCSCVAQHLNVPEGYASAFRSLRPRMGRGASWRAWGGWVRVDGLFEHPAPFLSFRRPVRIPWQEQGLMKCHSEHK